MGDHPPPSEWSKEIAQVVIDLGSKLELEKGHAGVDMDGGIVVYFYSDITYYSKKVHEEIHKYEGAIFISNDSEHEKPQSLCLYLYNLEETASRWEEFCIKSLVKYLEIIKQYLKDGEL